MGVCTRIVAILLVLTCTAAPLCAQILPWNIAVDADVRIEFLFGHQVLGREFLSSNYGVDTYLKEHIPDILDRTRIEYGPRLPVIEGQIEVSPLAMASARITGAINALQSNLGSNLVSGPASAYWNLYYYPNGLPPPILYASGVGSAELFSQVKPDFKCWEVAGLYHLSNGGGYRFSVVAGYRYERWRYSTAGGEGNDPYMRDDFVSQSPFIGLQTSMFFPWWKARCEVLGSSFMTKQVSLTAHQYDAQIGNDAFMFLEGTWHKGGFIEVQIDGSANITPSIWLGIIAKYTHEELRGEVKGTRQSLSDPMPAHATYETLPYDFYTLKSIATIGLNFSYVF